MKIRAVKLFVKTTGGDFGNTFQFDTHGLNILRADNSKGKSSIFNSIIYTLGLEAILGITKHIPLTFVFTRNVEFEDQSHKVLESYVLLEIENESNEIVTLKRWIKSERDVNLIQVLHGPFITKPSVQIERIAEYYARVAGSAQNERGFYFWLANFLKIRLPEVAKLNGQTTTLFVECIVPLMFIEQKRGWTQIQATTPMHYQIRDVKLKAMEFVLNLDSEKTSAKQREIFQELGILNRRWEKSISLIRSKAREVEAVVEGLPNEPIHSFEQSLKPIFKIHENKRIVTLEEKINQLETELREISQNIALPVSNENFEESSKELEELQAQIFEMETYERSLIAKTASISAEISLLNKRSMNLEDDIRQMQDAFKIYKMGGELQIPQIDSCPICNHQLDGTVLAQDLDRHVMSLEENLQFIKDESKTVEIMRLQSEKNKEIISVETAGLRTKLNETREKIRALKISLVEDSRLPSAALIQEKIQKELKLKYFREAKNIFLSEYEVLGDLSNEYTQLRASLEDLPDRYSETDEEKIMDLRNTLRDYLSEFGFSSFDPKLLDISKDTLHPIVEDLDWYFESSASDNVRAIWAFTLALLSVSQSYKTNHFGLLMFDEPRQHSAKGDSLKAFLGKAAVLSNQKAQIIMTTSEELKELENLVQHIPSKKFFFEDDERLIQPLS